MAKMTEEQRRESARKASRKYYHANQERCNARAKAYQAANSEKVKKKAAEYSLTERGVARRNRYMAKHRERVLARRKAARRANPNSDKAYREANRERRAEWQRDYRAAKPEFHKKLGADWRARNNGKTREYCAKRWAAKMRAMPPWVDRERITAIYEQASTLTRETGILHEVDHIVPLQGKTVCGLHVHYNLQVLPWVENRRKSNRLL